MATKKANDNAFAEVDNEAGESAVAMRATSNEMVLGALEGEEQAFLALPRLNVAYGVGNLAKAGFNPGDLVLMGEHFLVKRGEPLEVIILSAKTYWKEYISGSDFVDGTVPRIFDTEAEALAAGGTTRWEGGVGPTFSRAMCLKLLIRKPANVICGVFGVPLDGDEWAPAVWDVDKTAYNKVAPAVQTAARFSLRQTGLHSGRFEITTIIAQSKNSPNSTVAPTIKLIGKNSPEDMETLKQLFLQPSTEAAE